MIANLNPLYIVFSDQLVNCHKIFGSTGVYTLLTNLCKNVGACVSAREQISSEKYARNSGLPN